MSGGDTVLEGRYQTACLLYEFSESAYTGRMVVRPASAGWERVDSAPAATPP